MTAYLANKIISKPFHSIIQYLKEGGDPAWLNSMRIKHMYVVAFICLKRYYILVTLKVGLSLYGGSLYRKLYRLVTDLECCKWVIYKAVIPISIYIETA